MDPDMPNGDCDCGGTIPFRHLDANGHVPACGNWTWEMLWQERLAHNLAIAGALCRSFELGIGVERGEWRRVGTVGWIPAPPWTPGCGKAAP